MATNVIRPRVQGEQHHPVLWVRSTYTTNSSWDGSVSTFYFAERVDIGSGIAAVNLNSTDDEVAIYGERTTGTDYGGAGANTTSGPRTVALTSLGLIYGAVRNFAGTTLAVQVTSASIIKTEPQFMPNGPMRLEDGTTANQQFVSTVTSFAPGSSRVTLVSSSTGRVRVLGYIINHVDQGTTVMQLVNFASSNNDTALPQFLCVQGGGANLAPGGGWLFQTSTGEALNIVGSTIKTAITVQYVRTAT